jgi:glycosidase
MKKRVSRFGGFGLGLVLGLGGLGACTTSSAPAANAASLAAAGSAPAQSASAAGVRPVIYQLPVRLFGNTNPTRKFNGRIDENGVGKFADVNDAALDSLASLGVTWIYLTGVYRQATLTDWSSLGPNLGPDDPDVVKGIAGSFFAVRDYYDVCPDYANDPKNRIAEFDALVQRIHAHGMRVMIDLAANHVARGYKTVVPGKTSFGDGDDQNQSFSPNNSFYYIEPGTAGADALALPMTDWSPPAPFPARDGKYAPENGTPGHRPKYTGNNVTVLNPDVSTWYETIKINYGAKDLNLAHWYDAPALDPSVSAAHPTKTWQLMADVVGYWLKDRDVDGFRCDLVNMVPDEALKYLIAQGRAAKADSFFLAEVYSQYQRYFADGFDAVYHKDPWDSLKWISMAGSVADTTSRQTDLDRALAQYPEYDSDNPTWTTFTSDQRGKLLHFLENHDEARVGAKYLGPTSWTNSGWGGGLASHNQMAPVLLLASNGPVLQFAGAEVGEVAADAEGFGGDDGKTTMFDYWSFPLVSIWNHDHAYDGEASLPAASANLRRWYGKLYALAQDPVFRGALYAGLEAYNNANNAAGYPAELFAYARCAEGGKALGLVVANFSPDDTTTTSGTVRVPADFLAACGVDPSASLGVTVALDANSGKPDASASAVSTTIGGQALADTGASVSVRGRATSVLVLR